MHQLPLPGGGMETLHGHDWRVVIHVEGEKLDKFGVLVDFIDIQASLNGAVASWQHKTLNQTKEFLKISPSAEAVAEVLFRKMASKMTGAFHRLTRVVVTEAPNCKGYYGESIR